MIWIVFMLGAAVSWGLYGAMLSQGTVRLGSPMRALLCVGCAYFLIGIIIPVVSLSAQQGGFGGFNSSGTTIAVIAGTLGAAGAICIIYAFRAGGSPLIVMPLVFAGAPIVNVLYVMWQHPPKQSPNPLLYVGFLLAAAGAGMVLYFKPQS